MKKILFLIPLLYALTACDSVGEDERYIETGDVEVLRKVLLEEFTGQLCVNCPAAHKIIESLQEQYGDDLIVVSIHAGSFGIAAPVGLMEEEGDIYADRWNIKSYPQGVVDRTGSAETMDKWAATIRNDLAKDTDLQLNMQVNVSDNDNLINITTELLTSSNLDGFLQLWVVENGIVTFQQDGRNIIPNYVHNNVFRACVNGIWGQELPLQGHLVKSVENAITIEEDWNLDNLYIVGFYYNNSTGVIQVDRVKVTSNPEETPEE